MRRLSSGVDVMCSDYLGHFAVEYILSQTSAFSDQYRLSSDLPASFKALDERVLSSPSRAQASSTGERRDKQNRRGVVVSSAALAGAS